MQKLLDQLDTQLLQLFVRRLALAREVAKAGGATGVQEVNERAEAVMDSALGDVPMELEIYAPRFYDMVLDLTDEYRENLEQQEHGFKH